MAPSNGAAGPTLLERIAGKLDLARLRSDDDLTRLVEQRLPVRTLRALAAHGVSDDEIYRLVIPRRTLAHRRAKRQPLTPEESDRAVRVARIMAHAEKVFGDPEKAGRWLRKPKPRFDGRTPIDMLATECGARLVEEWLGQLEHGFVF